MTKVKNEKRIENAFRVFDARENSLSSQIVVVKNDDDSQNRRARRTDFNLIEQHAVLHKVWAALKYLLFYAPGVFLLYLTALFMSDYFIGGDYSTNNFIFSFVFVGGGIFLTMLGIGKLKNLKYLQVVAAILAASFAVGFAEQIFERAVFPINNNPYNYDHRHLLPFLIPFFLFVVAGVGLWVKRRLDREEAEL